MRILPIILIVLGIAIWFIAYSPWQILSDRKIDIQLRRAAEAGNLSEVEKILDEGARIDAVNWKSGYTALYLAIEAENVPLVGLLLRRGASVSKNVMSSSPLDLAIRRYREDESRGWSTQKAKEIIELLYKAHGVTNWHPLIEVGIILNDKEMIKDILKKTDVQKLKPAQVAHLFEALTYHADVKMLEYVHQQIPNLTSLKSNDGLLVHYAIRGGDQAISDYVIRHSPDINTKDRARNTPLHVAIKYESPDTVKLLLERGASLQELGAEGETPLELAKTLGEEAQQKVAKYQKEIEDNAEILKLLQAQKPQ